jgi:deazaflavin-dependent oxidoreductase (nitroreductase family)
MQRRVMVGINRTVNLIIHALRLNRFRGGQLLYLTTTGRKSGATRTVPLLYIRDGDCYIVAASNGGSDWEPGWWLNLRSDPRATVEVDGERISIHADEVDGDDRDRLWARLNEQLSDYAKYQAKVRRRIAVVELRPT